MAKELAINPAVLDPSKLGVIYIPPGQWGYKKNICLRYSWFENNSKEIPLGHKPYLCKSAEIEVTPGSRKSNFGVVRIPARSWKATRNPPKQQSTWTGILYFKPISDNPSISSHTQWGKLGKEPTKHIVFFV